MELAEAPSGTTLPDEEPEAQGLVGRRRTRSELNLVAPALGRVETLARALHQLPLGVRTLLLGETAGHDELRLARRVDAGHHDAPGPEGHLLSERREREAGERHYERSLHGSPFLPQRTCRGLLRFRA